MKKLFSVLIVMVMMLSMPFAYGEDYDKLFESLAKPVYSGKLEMEMKTELNKPLLIAELADDLMFGGETPVDIKLLLEGLMESTIKADFEYTISEDMKKADMAMSFQASAPLMINENLKLDAWSKWDMWIEYDFLSDTPVYKMVLKTPFLTDYILIDLSETMTAQGLDLNVVMPNMEGAEEYAEKIVESYKANSTISAKGNVYKINFDDAGFKNMFLELFKSIGEVTKNQLTVMQIPEKDVNEATASIYMMNAGFEYAKDKFSILGEDGAEIEIKFNPFGYIAEEKEKFHFALNIYDIMSAFGMAENAEFSGITKENSDIDFTISATAKFSKHNQKIEVKHPVLTDENTFVVPTGYTEPEEYPTQYNYFSSFEEGTPVIINSIRYVKLRNIVEECPFELSYENGTAYINTNSSYGVVEIKADCNDVVVNGETIKVVWPAVEKNDSIYVNEEILKLFGIEINGMSYSASAGETQVWGYYIDPDYVEEEYVEEYVDEEGPSSYFYVDADSRVPVFENGITYIPLFPLLGECNVGTEEISVSNGEITVVSDKAYGFTNLKIFENSLYAEKDGEEILLENPVKNIKGEYWAGEDFAEKVLSSQLDYVSIYSYGSTYSFERELE